jgi:hypothetical protein
MTITRCHRRFSFRRVVILHSKDLVNWEIAGHAVEDITKIGPEME